MSSKVFLFVSFLMCHVLYGTLGDTLAESAARFNHCGGQETGIMMLVPILIRPYAECGGLLSLAYDGQNSCVRFCVGEKIGLTINGLVSLNAARLFSQKLTSFAKKRILFNRSIECLDRGKFTAANECAATKRAYECFLQAFNEICEGELPKKRNKVQALKNYYDTDIFDDEYLEDQDK